MFPRAGDASTFRGPADLRGIGDPGFLYHSTDHSARVSADARFAGHCLAIILIGFFTMIARQKAITQMVGLVMENGVFWGDRGAYGMPLIVELGIF